MTIKRTPVIRPKQDRKDTGTGSDQDRTRIGLKPGEITHGAWSKHVRKRYSDLRTVEGQALRQILDGLIHDLGGPENLNAGQRLLLDTIQSKLIVILQIGKYVDQQAEIIEDGKLLPVLGQSYLAYLNSLRLTLDQLYKNFKPRSKKSLDEYLAETYPPTASKK